MMPAWILYFNVGQSGVFEQESFAFLLEQEMSLYRSVLSTSLHWGIIKKNIDIKEDLVSSVLFKHILHSRFEVNLK